MKQEPRQEHVGQEFDACCACVRNQGQRIRSNQQHVAGTAANRPLGRASCRLLRVCVTGITRLL